MSFEVDNFPQPLLRFSVATWLRPHVQQSVGESNQAISNQTSESSSASRVLCVPILQRGTATAVRGPRG